MMPADTPSLTPHILENPRIVGTGLEPVLPQLSPLSKHTHHTLRQLHLSHLSSFMMTLNS